MEKKILVTYASKYGATAEITERIAQVLNQAGLQTDLMPVKQVRDLDCYDAIILGSAVYIGRWRKDAVKFLKANRKKLTERLVWLFSSGPSGEGDPVELLNGWRFPPKLQSIADTIQPQSITVFHGNVDMAKLSLIEKNILSNVRAPVGDFRDWAAIESWAKSIAETLLEADLIS
jgi:menaquinone-dependent protoporphyrinogen oxidase